MVGALALTTSVSVIPHGSSVHAAGAEVPFGDKMGKAVANYDRIAPTIATGGLLKQGAIEQLKAAGFATVLDLRGPDEGIEPEKAAAENAGLRYLNIPVTDQAPGEAQVAAFARILENPANHPILIHCQTANRVGAIWVLYRVSKGIPSSIAIEEGRTIGLQPTRERAVRARLVLP